MMKHEIHKLFFIWEYEKEEKWINEMAKKGLILTKAGAFRYVFENGTPDEYQYRLEKLPRKINHPSSRRYIQFMEETGAEFITSVKTWAYFRKKTKDGPFEIYSDLHSKIKHLQGISNLLWMTSAFCIIIGIINIILGIRGLFVPDIIVGGASVLASEYSSSTAPYRQKNR